jgi:hypothetical protein
MANLAEVIWNNAIWYQSNPRPKWQADKPSKKDRWYTAIDQHFHRKFLPLIQNNGEKFVEYWPAFFFWGGRAEHKFDAIGDRPLLHKYGTYATGYLCLTNYNVIIVTIAAMTEQFPLYSSPGFVSAFFSVAAGEWDNRRPLKEDRIRSIGYNNILGAGIGDDRENTPALFITTYNELWQVYQHFTGTLRAMEVGINMGIAGHLAAIWNPPNQQYTQNPATNIPAETLELLKKLADLKNAGILTEAEFEQKKKDLLSRM